MPLHRIGALAGAEVCTAVAEVHAAAVSCRGDALWEAETIRRMLASPGGFGIVADFNQRLVGFVLARAIAGESEILMLAVHPEAQGRGFGRTLLTAALAAANSAGAGRMVLEVAADNHAALRLYTASGFAMVGRRPGYYLRSGKVKIDAMVMSRPLTSPASQPIRQEDGGALLTSKRRDTKKTLDDMG